MKKKGLVKGVSSVVVSSMVLGMLAGPAYNVKAEAPTADTLLFSEYVEGGSFNKALELFNGTENDLDLSQFTLDHHNGGAGEPTYSLELKGTLDAGETYVIANEKASQDILDVADQVTNDQTMGFNGNDTLVLKKDGVIIDSIGQVGLSDDFAKDVTLTRKTDQLVGDADPSDSFDINTSYNTHAKDTISYLGKYPDVTENVDVSKIKDARSVDDGTTVKVQGIVTASFVEGGQTNLYIQDDTAGIIVRAAGLDASIGDEVTAQGPFGAYNGLQQIATSADQVIVTTENKGTPDVQLVTSADFSSEQGESVESEYVKVQDITITDVNQYGDYTAEDEDGTFLISPKTDLEMEVGKTYELVEGVVTYAYGEYRLVPREEADVVETIFSVAASPSSGSVVKGAEIKLRTAQPDASIYYTMDGSDPTKESTAYTGPITLNEDTTIKAVVIKDSGEVSETASFSYEVLAPLDNVDIHDIQGAAHESPYKDMNVENVDGVVTALDGSNGFYMQDQDPDSDVATSEGIYVYSRNSGVSVGDAVNVNGQVNEWREDGYDDADDLLTTQISAAAVEVTSSDETLPDTTVIGEDRIQPTENVEDDGLTSFDAEEDAIDFYESLEGMVVELKDATVTGPPKYDEVAVYVDKSEDQRMTEAGGLLISPDDYNPERVLVDIDGYDVDVTVGDRMNGSITGVVGYDYSNFKIRTTGDFPTVEGGGTGRETSDLQVEEDKLNVATYNMENFSADTSQEKVDRIAESMVNNLNQPDIIGLVEVQDNNGPTDDGTVEADESYKKLIQAIENAGGPSYQFTDVAPLDKTDGGQPGGNIRVGFIYNPERVSLPDKEKGDAVTAVDVDENGLTLNPGRIDPENEAFDDSRKPLAAEFEFNGEKIVVVTSHFNSKGGDDALFGASHPIELGSEVQRMKQAEVVNGFVQKVVDHVSDANVVVMGDLNDFEFSNPINALEGDVMTNMVEELPVEERYSYNYQGNSQVLDHILVTNNLSERTSIDSVNINADFSEEAGRASDHDPMLAQIDFADTAERISGIDRYQTAIEVSKKGWEQSGTVVIARGDSFPDALAGAPLAYKLDAPILLTKSNKLSSEVKAELDRLGAEKAVILGGDGAVSDYVRYQLEGQGLSVERIDGKDRYETAANIAARLDGSPDKAIVADGRNYPDALSAASFAAQNGYPILLTKTNELPAETKRALKNMESTIVTGGTKAVSDDVLNQLPDAMRVSGADRYATAAKIAGELSGNSKAAFVSTGRDFADALTGSVLAAKYGAPMLLVKPDDIPDSIDDVIESMDYRNFHVLGGTKAVSDDVLNELQD
ncbi:cell wall-binding repeat-containing protein [Halobacillus kuroshimensis]|uniref:cell wall-binding repeat-containing protein n=1 Tax=Halobacillus kuroshimensis TaxID=302481 RepID=UPI0003F90227|nr:cell wall-binding repeat-containing protein [Halobacillus kuroshimensis]